jgi:hypothetical protein
MIKLFRNFRKQLLNEGKTTKYFKYAIGEIVLVVIGILIALQINNWNSWKNDRKEEQAILKSLLREFKNNLVELERDHTLNKASLDALFFLLNEKRETLDPKEIDSLVGTAFNYATFDAGIGVFDETISSGKMQLIENDSLRTILSQWTGELNDLSEDALIRRDYILHNASPLFRKYIPLRNIDNALNREDYERNYDIKPMTFANADYKGFFNSMEVDGTIYEMYWNQSFTTSNESSLKLYIEDVIALLEKNIIK